MSIPTVVVTVDVFESDGTALAGAIVKARMTGFDVYNDQIIDRVEESTTTNVSGRATLALFPNTLGQNDTAYVFTIRHPTTNRKLYATVAQVPNAACNLTDIADNVDSPAVSAPVVEDAGIVVRGDDGVYRVRELQAPAAGITITNPTGQDGNPTLVLANDLAALEGLATSGLAERTAVDTWVIAPLTAYAKALLSIATAALWRVGLGLEIGVNVQVYSLQVTNISALTPTDSNIIVGDGTTWVVESGATARTSLGAQAAHANLTSLSGITLTAAGLALLDDADAAAQRTTLGLANAALLNVEDQALTGGFVVTPKSLGTITTGTVTPDPGDRPLQYYVNGGAHTLAPSANKGSYIIDIINNGSAGAITTSGWTKVVGDSFNTTLLNQFRCTCSIGESGSLLSVQAMQ